MGTTRRKEKSRKRKGKGREGRGGKRKGKRRVWRVGGAGAQRQAVRGR